LLIIFLTSNKQHNVKLTDAKLKRIGKQKGG